MIAEFRQETTAEVWQDDEPVTIDPFQGAIATPKKPFGARFDVVLPAAFPTGAADSC